MGAAAFAVYAGRVPELMGARHWLGKLLLHKMTSGPRSASHFGRCIVTAPPIAAHGERGVQHFGVRSFSPIRRYTAETETAKRDQSRTEMVCIARRADDEGGRVAAKSYGKSPYIEHSRHARTGLRADAIDGHVVGVWGVENGRGGGSVRTLRTCTRWRIFIVTYKAGRSGTGSQVSGAPRGRT